MSLARHATRLYDLMRARSDSALIRIGAQWWAIEEDARAHGTMFRVNLNPRAGHLRPDGRVDWHKVYPYPIFITATVDALASRKLIAKVGRKVAELGQYGRRTPPKSHPGYYDRTRAVLVVT